MRIARLALFFLLASCATGAPPQTPEQAIFAQIVAASVPYQKCKLRRPWLVVSPSDSVKLEVEVENNRHKVTINRGMLDLLAGGVPDELASIFGHEIAHAVKCHFHGSAPSEREADVIGACIARAAGYSERKAIETFFARHPPETPRAKAFLERVRYVLDNDISGYC